MNSGLQRRSFTNSAATQYAEIRCANLEVARNRQVKADQCPHPHQNEERSNRNRCHRRSIIKPSA
jgi:hypothetical protein